MQGTETPLATSQLSRRPQFAVLSRLRWRPLVAFAVTLSLGLTLLGGSTVPAGMEIWRSLDTISQAWRWDIVGWEFDAVGQKLHSQFVQPLKNVPPAGQARLVRDYLARERTIGQLEWQLDQLYAQPVPGDDATAGSGPDAATLARRQQIETQLTVLREQQSLVQPAIEQTIEHQVGGVLAAQKIGAGLPAFPPVWFTFIEPPRKLVASPRAYIQTAYYTMLQPNLPADQREQIEATIEKQFNLSAYITQIGGLGAYPTIVTNQAPLEWILSTVAHEWVHNYLTLFPLGINYDKSPELTILNETVADIAGDELGAATLAANYPELVRLFPGKDEPAPTPVAANTLPPFDFRKEMRHTREVVDMFLKAGRVEDAEEYMKIRRILFQENGYSIRKLNQAYFAFHGAYGTGAAATSPIGPKLQELRALMPDLRTFLATVRWFTSEADLDAALQQWAGR